MKKQYNQSLAKVLQGDLNQAASHAYENRDECLSVDEQISRALIAFRLAMKAGNLSDFPAILDDRKTNDTFLKGEIHLVKGTFSAMTSQHATAAELFAQAATFYAKCDSHEKKALSLFNSIIAKSYDSQNDLLQEAALLSDIIAFCIAHDIPKILFLCHRHQSFRSFENQNYQASLQVLLPWVARKDTLTKSDSELALLHIADCFWELRNLKQALHYFEQVPEEVDERVRFPKAFIYAKIYQGTIDIQAFPMVTDHWRNRFSKSHFTNKPSSEKKTKALAWSFKTGLLTKGSRLHGKIKPQTLEGRCLRLLVDGAKSKAVLCETLWPNELETIFLDDRFHQMIQRIQRKTQGLILFDGSTYKLNETLQIL